MTYEELCQFETIYRAYLSACSGKRSKRKTVAFESDALCNVRDLAQEMADGTHRPGGFELFKVYEPKERMVQAPDFKDKVVLHAVTDNILYDAITRSFVRDNYASQLNKGTADGLARLKLQMQRYYRRYGTADGWVLKGDVRHFFASIPHGPLKEKLRAVCIKRGVDVRVYDLLCLYIDNTEEGLPLGYQTSQLLALLYLDDFDHWIKEHTHCDGYGRYMDDFFVISPDKKELRILLAKLREWMQELGLELNQKTAIYPLKNGIDFIGFHLYLTDTGQVVQKLRRQNIQRIKARVRRWKHEYPEGKITKDQVRDRWRAWDAYAASGDTYSIRKEIADEVGEIIGETLTPRRKIRSTKYVAAMRRARQEKLRQKKHRREAGETASYAAQPRPPEVLPWAETEQ